MFNFFKKKEYTEQSAKAKRLQQMEHFLQATENGIINSVPNAYCGIIESDREYIKRFGKALNKIISSISARQLIKFSETFREHTSMCWYYDWENFNAETIKNYTECEQDYIAIIAVGTFHPNGYYRQQCIEKLAQYDNVVHYILLRLNDWVKDVRTSAERIIDDKIKKCTVAEIFSLSPYIYKLNYSGRLNHDKFDKILSYINSIIENHSDNVNIYEIKKYDFETRKSIYKILCRNAVLPAEKFEKMIDIEKHSFCQSFLITHYLQLYNPDMKKTDEFLMHKSSYVRYVALQHKYNILHNIWDGIEKFLLDSRKAIREFTVYYLKKHTDFDIPAFYRKNLHSENPLFAIVGLGETSIKSDCELIKPFLKSDNSRIVSASITAINYLSQSENQDIYWEYLHDNRINVVKSAYLAIKQSKIRYDSEKLYNEIINTENENMQKYLINILCWNEDSWERLPYLMKIYFSLICNNNVNIEHTVYSAINKRNIYAKISPKLQKEIHEEIHEICQIKTDDIIKKIIIKSIIWGIEQDLKYMCR